MNILNDFRKPYISIFLSFLVLFVSCQETILSSDEEKIATFESSELSKLGHTFDYTVFNTLKGNSDVDNILDILSDEGVGDMDTVEKSETILDTVNLYYSTNVEFPIEFHQITESSPANILSVAQTNGWINQDDINLISQFETDVRNSDFDTALTNYENSVLNLNLSDKEFAKKNNIANAIKTLNHYSPEIFSRVNSCLGAIISLVVATFGILTCATGFFCVAAIIGYTAAYYNYNEQCRN